MTIMTFWLLLVVVAVCVIILRYKTSFKVVSNIPRMPGALPFLGIAHQFFGDAQGAMNMWKKYSYEAIKQQGWVYANIVHKPYYTGVDPVDIEVILKACLDKEDFHQLLRVLFGNAGAFATVQGWSKRRKLLYPSFAPKCLQDFMSVFSQNSQKLAANFDEFDGKQFSAWSYINAYTLDSVTENIMGTKVNAQEHAEFPFLIALNEAIILLSERCYKIWLYPNYLFWLTPKYTTFQKNLKIVLDFVDEIIKNKKEHLKKENNKGTDADYKNADFRRKTLLDYLINLPHNENRLSDKELNEEMLNMIIGAADTSGLAIGYTLTLLGKYPKIQDRVYIELQEVFGESDRPVSMHDLPKLKYLERVIKESLRLFPPVPLISRSVLKETTTPSGRTFPAGSTVFISIWGVHRDPKYWGPDAEHFDPDRFLPERFNLKHPCCYMPFSYGPRKCIGLQYAFISMKTALSTIIRRFKVVGEEEAGPVPHIRTMHRVMMKSVDDFKIVVERRMCNNKTKI